MASNSTWADGPFPLISTTGSLEAENIPEDHAAVFFARQMALIHNTMLRSLNSIYRQCLSIQPGTQEASDILIYAQCFYEMLHHHHHVEEEVFFPDIEKLAGKEGLMEGNVEQHKQFEEGLTRFQKYVYETPKEDYDGAKLKAIIDSFGQVLVTHLHAEIPTLLSLHYLDSKEMMKLWKRAEYAATHDVDPHRNAPLVFGCQDNTFLLDGEVRNFPAAPFFVPYLVNLMYTRKFTGAWKFNPCSIFKSPRPLQFI